ncbi:MAG TPA: tetratricopeptide repeat protein [Planctomycetota bacterium]|nr:tetratricopeptide repeat protein [Planctomycetota bacterium]
MNETAEEYFRRAYEAQMAGELEQAVDLYSKSIALNPTAEAHTFLGWTYSFQRKYREAIAECRRAIEVDPAFGNPYNDIGAYLIELGRWEEAIPWFEKAIDAPRYDPRHFPHFNLARVYIQTYEYGKAVGHLQRALELEPRYASAQKELRRLLCRMN